MKVTKNIDIYLTGKRPVKVIDVVQYDTGIQVVFTVKDFTIPSDATATLYVQKPSGKFVYQQKNITIAENKITVDLENQALTEYGRTPYQMTVSSGSDTVTSFAGLMIVERSLNDAGAVESRTVIKAFDEVTAERIAEFQTNAETIANAVIATIPDDYIELTAKVNESANAIKGHLSGAVVAADDVSPVEHLMNVKVHGKNLVQYGTITFTKNQSCLLDNPIPAGTYTISAYITSSDTDGIYSAVSINNKNEVMKYIALKRNERVSSTFTVTKPITSIDFCAGYNYSQGVDDTATWADIQLEKGDTATEYTPYIDPSTTTISAGGETYTPNADGTVTGISSTVLADGISANTEGMVVECEYNKDSNKVIKKITDALGITI